MFSGIGGFALGFQQAGINIEKHYFSEVDKYAISIYRRYFPDAIPLGDITRIKNINKRINLISGGFPCQSFSIAGKRRGFSDTRGTLFFDIARLAKELRPEYMVLENVKGIYSHDDGHTLDVILSTLDGLNYDTQLLLVNSKDFGVPQNRERAFFICNFRGESRPEISSIRERQTAIAFSSNAIDSNYWKGIDNHGQRTCIEITKNQSQGYRVYDPAGTSTTLAGEAGGVGAKTGLYQISKTIRSSSRGSCDKKHNWDHILDDSIIRRLTPVECERLQGFPDNWTEGISDTQRYKTLGNAVTVNVIKAIGESLREAMNENTI